MIPDSKEIVKVSRKDWLMTWTEKKALSLCMAAKLKSQQNWRLKKRGERMEHCADLVTFNECQDCGSRRVRTASLCKDRVCPLCNWRLANKRWVTLYNALSAIDGPGIMFHFITLTIHNIRPERLSEALGNMARAWNRVLQRQMIKNHVMGWARSVEVTYNKDTGMMHPHYHVIMITENKLELIEFDRDEILDFWVRSVTKEGEFANLKGQDARQIKTDDENENLLAAALETYKYTIKQQDLLSMPAADFVFYVKQIAGKRLTATGGILKDRIKTDLDEIDDKEEEQCPVCGSTNLAAACMEWAGTTYRII